MKLCLQVQQPTFGCHLDCFALCLIALGGPYYRNNAFELSNYWPVYYCIDYFSQKPRLYFFQLDHSLHTTMRLRASLISKSLHTDLSYCWCSAVMCSNAIWSTMIIVHFFSHYYHLLEKSLRLCKRQKMKMHSPIFFLFY